MEVSGLPSPHSETVLDSFPGRKTARQRLACRKVMACALGSKDHGRVGWGRGRRCTAPSCRHRDLSRSHGELWPAAVWPWDRGQVFVPMHWLSLGMGYLGEEVWPWSAALPDRAISREGLGHMQLATITLGRMRKEWFRPEDRNWAPQNSPEKVSTAPFTPQCVKLNLALRYEVLSDLNVTETFNKLCHKKSFPFHKQKIQSGHLWLPDTQGNLHIPISHLSY